MNMLGKIISTLVKRITLTFTLIVMTFTVVGSFANMEGFGKGLAITQLMTFFVFSCLLAVSFGICDFVKNNTVIRRTLHFVLSYASLALSFFTSSMFKEYLASMQNPAFSVLSISFIFVIIYTVVSVVVLVCRFLNNRFTNSNKEYTQLFDTENQDK